MNKLHTCLPHCIRSSDFAQFPNSSRSQFLAINAKSQKDIKEELDAIYEESGISLSVIQKLSSEFERGRRNIED